MDWTPYHLDQLAYAFGGPVGRAELKAEPEDFRVDEVLGFTPSGSGEHLFLHIQKRNHNTGYIAEQLAKVAQVSVQAVSYSGLKDRRAVTSQWFSLHCPGKADPDLSALWDDDLRLLASTRNDRKLRRGAHQANRFTITLRNVSGERGAIEARLQQIATCGVPNYFGPQRFGHDYGNLPAGEALLARIATGGRLKRNDRREALYLSAVRSALFNRIVSERVAAGHWDRWLEGEVMNLDGRGSFFRPDAWDDTLAERLASLDIHPTAPLFGAGVPVIDGEAAALDVRIAADVPALIQGLEAAGLEAQRRPSRLKVMDLRWRWVDDATLELGFALTTGAFATSVLREVLAVGGEAESPEA